MKDFDDLYFVDSHFNLNEEIPIPYHEAKHFLKVKRSKRKEMLNLCNGRGLHGIASWHQAEDKSVSAMIKEVNLMPRNRPFELYLAPALLKKTSYEWVLEKSTELGIDHIVPLTSQNIVADKPKYDRWEKIIISAIKQSKNFWKPELHPQVDISNLSSQFPEVNWICFHEKATNGIDRNIFNDKNAKIGIVIGPEGGLSNNEINLFQHIFLLTKSRLRAETASITAINQIDLLYRWIFPT